MPDNTIAPAVTTAVHVVQYTQTELMKIYVSGGILAVAVLILTYYGYKWYMARYTNWRLREEMQERLDNGEAVNEADYQPVPSGVNKKVFLVVGVAVILVGIVQYMF
jgi:hypothetical protein